VYNYILNKRNNAEKNVRFITSAASDATGVPNCFYGSFIDHIDIKIKLSDSRRTCFHEIVEPIDEIMLHVV